MIKFKKRFVVRFIMFKEKYVKIVIKILQMVLVYPRIDLIKHLN